MNTERAREIIEEALKDWVCIENPKPEDRFVEDLGLDSLDVVEVLIHVEDEIGQNFEDSEVEQIKTVGEAIEFLAGKLPEAAP